MRSAPHNASPLPCLDDRGRGPLRVSLAPAASQMFRIVCLDEDHVMTLIGMGMTDWTPDDERWLRAFFAPEPFDIQILAAMGEGLRTTDGVGVTHARGNAASVAGAHIILLRRGTVDAAMIAACPDLRLVQRLGARTDGIDLDGLRSRGIAVSCLARRSLAVTAEHAILLMLALGKRLPEADRQLRAGQYDPSVVNATKVAYNWIGLPGVGGLNGRVLGIVGLGEVGAAVARLAVAFGMRVIYTNRKPLPPEREAALGVGFRPLPDLMTEADFVSIHAPNTPETRHLVGPAEIARMRCDAFLVNTSRGALVDEDALYAALREGRIAGAGLDVHATEPRDAADRFCALANVILTPHLAGGSRRGLLAEVAAIYDNFRSVLAGAAPLHDRIA